MEKAGEWCLDGGNDRGMDMWTDGRMGRRKEGWVGRWMDEMGRKSTHGSSGLEQPCRAVPSQAEMDKPFGPHIISQAWPVGCSGRGVASWKGVRRLTVTC